LAEGVDLAPFFQTPPISIVSESPRIAVVRVSAVGICRWLIARAKPSLIPAEVYDRNTGRLIVDPNRNNRAALFPPVLSDLILLLVRERVPELSAVRRPSLEQPSVLNYARVRNIARTSTFAMCHYLVRQKMPRRTVSAS